MKQSKRSAFTLSAVAVVALLLWMSAPTATTVVQATTGQEIIKLANFNLGSSIVSLVALIFMVAATAYAWWLNLLKNRKLPRWLTVSVGLVLVIDILVILFAGKTLTITSLLQGALALSVPLIFGSLAGVMCERSGVVNIAIEGQLLAGAFTSALVASLSKNLYAGLVGAIIAGAFVSWILAVFAIKYVVDQIIVGVVLNVLFQGITNFLFTEFMDQNKVLLNQPPRFENLAIPGLSQIPVLGPTLFDQPLIVYLMYVSVAAVWVVLFKTRWGLRLRAVGEYPLAADTVGIKVYRARYLNVIIGGALAGLGGAFFTLGQVGAFGKEMSNGAGYIALAALIFGRWNPIYAAFAALLFGFAENLRQLLSVVGSVVPTEFLEMLPYALTVLAVAGLVGKVRGPAASGKAYVKS
jgi:ABC-type uncharacterized transport system permease subunit